MTRILALMAAWALAGFANAEWYTAYANTFDSLDGVGGGDPACEPYLYDGGAWIDVLLGGPPCGVMYVMMDPVNGINIDPPIDFTYGELTVTLQWYSELWTPGEIVGFWVRLYSRAWDEDAEEWVLSGMQNYFYEVEQSGPGGGPGWQTWTRPVADYNETDFLGPFIDDQVYMFRIDVSPWIAPSSFGISHFELVVPECPNDADGDDDVDLQDLALLLSEYGCTPEETTFYDTSGFEAYELGDLHEQDGWWADPSAFLGVVQVIADPTGGGMGNVVLLDAQDGSGDCVWIEHAIDPPISDGITVFEWDQYRTDAGDNIYHGNCGGWFAAEWDSADPPGQLSPSGWAGGPTPSFNEWHHVRYELNLERGVARVTLDDGEPAEGRFVSSGPTTCISWGMLDTFAPGDGPLYLDNVVVKQMFPCPIDYNDDGYTDLNDLATLLSAYGCGGP